MNITLFLPILLHVFRIQEKIRLNKWFWHVSPFNREFIVNLSFCLPDAYSCGLWFEKSNSIESCRNVVRLRNDKILANQRWISRHSKWCVDVNIINDLPRTEWSNFQHNFLHKASAVNWYDFKKNQYIIPTKLFKGRKCPNPHPRQMNCIIR